MENKPKAIAELSLDTQELVRALDVVEQGDTISYDDLSRVIGRSVQDSARGNLISARRILLRDNQKVFECVKNVGIKLLQPHEVPALGVSAASHIRRTSMKTIQKLSTVIDSDQLPPPARARLNFDLSCHAMIHKVMQESTIKKLQAKIENRRLPLAKFLDSVKENI